MVALVAVLAPAVAFEPWQHREVVSELPWKYSDLFVPAQPSVAASDPSELGLHSGQLAADASELPD